VLRLIFELRSQIFFDLQSIVDLILQLVELALLLEYGPVLFLHVGFKFVNLSLKLGEFLLIVNITGTHCVHGSLEVTGLEDKGASWTAIQSIFHVASLGKCL
jgi:hypothetical protein